MNCWVMLLLCEIQREKAGRTGDEGVRSAIGRYLCHGVSSIRKHGSGSGFAHKIDIDFIFILSSAVNVGGGREAEPRRTPDGFPDRIPVHLSSEVGVPNHFMAERFPANSFQGAAG
jgi:hypothetical protein